MQLAELPNTLTERIGCLIQPVLPRLQASDHCPDVSELRGPWQPVGLQLADWKNNPDELEDEGVVAPTRELVALAEDVAEALCGYGVDPPDRVVTNGDGGIVMRWRLLGRTWSIEMDGDGSIESSLLVGNRLLWRHSIHQNAAQTS